jgi:hypothetical protein
VKLIREIRVQTIQKRKWRVLRFFVRKFRGNDEGTKKKEEAEAIGYGWQVGAVPAIFWF